MPGLGPLAGHTLSLYRLQRDIEQLVCAQPPPLRPVSCSELAAAEWPQKAYRSHAAAAGPGNFGAAPLEFERRLALLVARRLRLGRRRVSVSYQRAPVVRTRAISSTSSSSSPTLNSVSAQTEHARRRTFEFVASSLVQVRSQSYISANGKFA